MILDRDDHSFTGGAFDLFAINAALAKWRDFPPSTLAHHGALCCTVAREWISSTDFSYLHGASILAGPRWIRQRFDWGPSRWPIAWCEAVKEKTLDCGAHSALAREVFRSRGLMAHAVQLVQQYSEYTTKHWEFKWREADVSHEWIFRDLIYHEACAIETAHGQIKIWDPSAATWISPNGIAGFGSLLAWRVTNAVVRSERDRFWGESKVAWNAWQLVTPKRHAEWATARAVASDITAPTIGPFESILAVEEAQRNDAVPVG